MARKARTIQSRGRRVNRFTLSTIAASIVAFVIYVVVTILSAIVLARDDKDNIPLVAWLIGGMLYSATVIQLLGV